MTITSVPVEGNHVWLLSDQHVLTTLSLAVDRDLYLAQLRPVIQKLA